MSEETIVDSVGGVWQVTKTFVKDGGSEASSPRKLVNWVIK